VSRRDGGNNGFKDYKLKQKLLFEILTSINFCTEILKKPSLVLSNASLVFKLHSMKCKTDKKNFGRFYQKVEKCF
jgi:hypothetical protein